MNSKWFINETKNCNYIKPVFIMASVSVAVLSNQPYHEALQNQAVPYVGTVSEYSFLENTEYIDFLQIINLDKIHKMSEFQNDWNGTGGKEFSRSAISKFERIIKILPYQPEIAPTGRNSMFMQYKFGNRTLAFEVREKNTDSVLVTDNNYSLAQMKSYVDDEEDNIRNEVIKFYESQSDF